MGILLALAQSAFAQVAFQTSRTASRTVTILSDGISDPNGAASQILSDIAITLDKASDLRVLSVSGYGGPANARDLLQLRGADLAVVNNDVLAYLDILKTLPEARRKIRLIAPLYNQRALLFARREISSIGDLKGRKVGIQSSRPSRGVTARTVFGALKINVEFIELADEDLAKKAADLDAILIFESDLPHLKTFGISSGVHRLLPIPAAGPLAQIYLPGKALAPGFGSGDGIETIKVTTLLATYDWTPKQGRYGDAVSFVAKFFELLPAIRERSPNSIFARTNVRTELPGWQRFGPAQSLAAAAPVVAIEEEVLPLPVLSAEPPAPKDAIRLLAVAHPPLTNAQQGDGGVALKLLTGALEAAGVDVSVRWVDGERALLEGLASSKTADAGLFSQTLACDAPSDQSAAEAEACDAASFSEPVMQAVVGIFTRIDTPLKAVGQEIQTRTVCAPESQPVLREAFEAFPWLEGAKLKILRRRSLVDCIAALESHDADAFVAIEPEGRFAVEKLALTQSLQLSQRLSSPIGLHALVAKDNPRQAEIMQTINDAIAKFRKSDRYSAVMASHIADLTGSAAKLP
jgi:ABC-type amino acid transport substrate-binding protein